MTKQLGYTPVSSTPYPEYFNITKTDTGYRVTTRSPSSTDPNGVSIIGGSGYIDIPEHFAFELLRFLEETIPTRTE